MAVEALTIFLSALLLFQVEPIVGKGILPWFGGAPAVWTTCLLFFQTLLLAGYLYAHAVATRLSPRAQRAIHLAAIGLSLLALAAGAAFSRAPVLPPAALRPPDASAPVARVLAALFAGVGLPFFVLATTGPLLQAWIARRAPRARVFRLYALSNLGSLLGLLAYPFLVEPALSLTAQARVWSAAYALFAAGAALAAIRAGGGGERAKDEPLSRIPRTTLFFWFGLAACGSALLLATTNELCQEVAAIPFLWVFPLAIYLLTFILCFESDRIYRRGIFGPLLVGSLAWAAVTLDRGYTAGIREQVASYGLALFAAGMTCHGELARSRPAARQATHFYLAIAAGGAAGAAFVAVVAPLVFPAFWEIHLLLWLSGAAALAALLADSRSWVRRGSPYPALAALAVLAAVAWRSRDPDVFESLAAGAKEWLGKPSHAVLAAAPLVAAGYLIVLFRRPLAIRGRPYLAGTALAGALGFLMVALAADVKAYLRGAVALSRNFYGVLTLEELDSPDPELSRLSLRHGRIVHGFQYQSAAKRRIPTTYYGEGSGIALAIENHPRRAAGGMRVGVVGLGTGTLAAYGRAGDVYRFYDINPAVVRLSTGADRRFTYVADCPAKVEIVMGDARLSMERELGRGEPQRFDVLAIDAFSSDAIPVHLLTREALALYAAHLATPGGILAVHVSNRQLDLKPVVREGARALGLFPALIDTNDAGQGVWGATWILLARDAAAFRPRPILKATAEFPEEPRIRLWTDDYSNLFEVLK